MRWVNKLSVWYRDRKVGVLSMTPDNQRCVFQYDPEWLISGFSISPIDLPLKPKLFIAKPEPFWGNFGIFEDSLPDGYGRYLLNRLLKKQRIDDSNLTPLQRLNIVGSSGMGALCYLPETYLGEENWLLAPAYDLTLNREGYKGEHATSVNNQRNPSVEDMSLVGENIRISRKRGKEIIKSVAENCQEIISMRFRSL